MDQAEGRAILRAMVGQDVPYGPDAALAREWLITNGVGGSASGTVAGATTRRIHALLLVASPNGRRQTLLLKLDEHLRSEAGTFALGLDLFADGQANPSAVPPIEEFRLEPWPTWRFRAGETVIEKSVFTIHGHHAVAVTYRHLSGPVATLSVSPLVVARDPMALESEDAELGRAVQGVPGRVRIETRPGYPTLTLWHNGVFMPARVWQRHLLHPLDRLPGNERAGKSAPARTDEDALVPGHFKTPLSPGGTLHIVASSEDDLFRALAAEERLGVPPPRSLAECVAALATGESQRLEGWRRSAREGADFTARQAAAAHGGAGERLARRREPLVEEDDAFILPLARGLVSGLTLRGARLTLVESLPAGVESGAAALRAVPALLAIRAFDAARQILGGYVDFLDEGLVPESFDPEDGRPVYGDPSASLWLVYAADLFVRRSGETEFLSDRLYQPLESIMQSYRQGTRYGIAVDRDGLLTAGEGDQAMKRSDLNALWYHALVAMAQLARLIGRKESGAFYLAWAREHQKQFNDELWDEAHGCLYEGLGPRGPVPGISPSQLLAVSLPPPVLQPDSSERLVATLERAAFTPLGMRETVAARGGAGGGGTRLSTAWLGPFITAYLRTHQRSPEAQRRAQEWLLALHRRSEHLLGGLPPEFDLTGEPDSARDADGSGPRAVAAGAGMVSVLAAAELLRVWIEELDRSETASAASPLAST